jgi:hypothetical protein
MRYTKIVGSKQGNKQMLNLETVQVGDILAVQYNTCYYDDVNVERVTATQISVSSIQDTTNTVMKYNRKTGFRVGYTDCGRLLQVPFLVSKTEADIGREKNIIRNEIRGEQILIKRALRLILDYDMNKETVNDLEKILVDAKALLLKEQALNN